MQVLRDYQERGLAAILAAFKAGHRAVLAVAPTGSGKTTIFSALAAQVAAPVLLLVHRRELAKQAALRLREFGVLFGYLLAGEPTNIGARVQIASVQTLVRRRRPPAGLIIADEAHLSTADTWSAVLDAYPHARILGVTATPWRLSGKPLAGAYDSLVVVARPSELRAQGHLSPYVGFSYQHPDLSGVSIVGDDYNQKETGALMSAIVPNVVEQWLAQARHLSTVVFAATVEHSRALVREFRGAGIVAEHLDGGMPLSEREGVLRRVENGQTQVLANVGVAVEGLDIPRLKCCVLARPTKSLSRAIQMMGRVRRPWNDITARIHDHAFVIASHGLPDQDREYTLSAREPKDAPPALRTCRTCLAIYEGDKCPACGSAPEPRPRGELREVRDAERIEFVSEETPGAVVALPPAPARTSVTISWDRPGRVITGVYERVAVEWTPYGDKPHYYIRTEKRDYILPSTSRLAILMARVPVGASIRVTYLGFADGGAKHFRVEVDDGT